MQSADLRALIEAKYDLRRQSARGLQKRDSSRQEYSAFEEEQDLAFFEVASLRDGAPPLWYRTLSKMGFGPTLADQNLFLSMGSSDQLRLAAWVEYQLAWRDIDDSAVELRLSSAGYTTLGKSRTALWKQHAKTSDYATRMRPGFEVQRAKFLRAVFSKRQLHEAMVDFWHDHFNTLGVEYGIAPNFVSYDRDVVRRYALDNFKFLLTAVAKSTAMLYYLDNVNNTRSGPNENWARELLELHTMGSENYYAFANPFEIPRDEEDPSFPSGYTDIDVYETASAFTGWTINNGHWQYPSLDDGLFGYRSTWHDQGPKLVLGMLLNPEQPALKDGEDILDRLAKHPKVARFICSKLIRRFVGGEPDPELVSSAAQIFRSNWNRGDQLVRVMRHILMSAEFSSSWGLKIRRPFEAVVAAMRAMPPRSSIRMGNAFSDQLMWRMTQAGNAPFEYPAPNGYPDHAVAWCGSGSLAMTWKLLNWLTEAKDGAAYFLPVIETSRVAVSNWTAFALVDWWSRRLTGAPLPPASRNAVAGFLAQNGNATTMVIQDNDIWSGGDLKHHYNHQRIRSAVSLIMMTPQFLNR